MISSYCIVSPRVSTLTSCRRVKRRCIVLVGQISVFVITLAGEVASQGPPVFIGLTG
jgi:hypothetical protein